MSNLSIETLVVFTINVTNIPKSMSENFQSEFLNPEFRTMLFPPILLKGAWWHDNADVLFNDGWLDRVSITSSGEYKYMYRVSFRIRQYFLDPINIPAENKLRINKYAPTTDSEVKKLSDTLKQLVVSKSKGKVFVYKDKHGNKLPVQVVNCEFEAPVVSRALRASFYTNGEIQRANVATQSRQEQQLVNEVAERIGVANVGDVIRPFLGGRRRQTRRRSRKNNTRKHTRK